MTERKPTVFIGSSGEDVGLVDALVKGLGRDAHPKPWTGAFNPSETTLDGLFEAAKTADAAVFVFGPSDWTESRDKRQQAPRDNVVYEAGLFAGEIGIDRTFLMCAEGVKLPSDLLGLTSLRYDSEDDDPSRQAEPVLAAIRQRLRQLGSRDPVIGAWWQHTLGGDRELERAELSLLEVKRGDDGSIRVRGYAWTGDGNRFARFRSKEASPTRDPPGLFYYWEGEWNTEGVPELFGVGKIEMFEGVPDRMNGWFTTTKRSDRKTSDFTNVLYTPATKAEVNVVKTGSADECTQLAQDQLDREVPFS